MAYDKHGNDNHNDGGGGGRDVLLLNDDDGGDDGGAEGVRRAQLSLHAACVVLLWIKLLGYLKGTSMKMATFVLMLQEIIHNIDSFLFVLALVIVMFSMLYHLMLRNDPGADDDGWREFDSSVGRVTTVFAALSLNDVFFLFRLARDRLVGDLPRAPNMLSSVLFIPLSFHSISFHFLRQ
jgi:hypothetical protein